MSRRQEQKYDYDSPAGENDSSIRNLDEYLEMLYEVPGNKKQAEQQTQVLGTQKILSLCRHVPNLEQLIQNNTVMGALTRVLQEEYKKSVEVTFNILRIFLAFSNFSEMHTLMGEYRMGALTMKTIEYEMRRLELQNSEAQDREQFYSNEIRQLKSNRDMRDEDMKAAIVKLKKDKKKEMDKHLRKKRKHEKVLFSFYTLLNLSENLSVERKMTKKSLITDLVSLIDPRPPSSSTQNEVSGPLTVTLADLLLVACSFLRKLSIFSENKDAIRSSGLVERLVPYLPCSHPPVTNSILRLLFNLSFDAEIREQMLRGGLVPALVSLLCTPSFRSRSIRVLYHLSCDDRCRLAFAKPLEVNGSNNATGLSVLMGVVVNFPQPVLPLELAALAINLSLNPSCAELMIANKGLNYLMDRLTILPSGSRQQQGVNGSGKSKLDVFLIKILRNIALYTFDRQKERESAKTKAIKDDKGEEKDGAMRDKERGLWSPHVKTLVELVMSSYDNQDVLIELLGILGCLTVRDLPSTNSWARLLRDQGLLQFLSRLLVPGATQPDVLLEVILVLSASTAEPLACEVIASSSALGLLYQLFKEKIKAKTGGNEKNPDVELPLQMLYLFYRLLMNESSREELMYSTRIIADILDCMSHRNNAMRRVAALCADLLTELENQGTGIVSKEIAHQLIKARFESYNAHWLLWAANAPESSIESPARRPVESTNKYNYHFADELEDVVDDSTEQDWRRLQQSSNVKRNYR